MLYIAKAVLLVVAGVLLVRLGGRKSIAEMTIGSVVVVMALADVFSEPLSHDSVLWTVAGSLCVLCILYGLEWLQLKSVPLENLLSGKPIVVVENGQIVKENLRKLRMSVASLEMRLRQARIERLTDVKTATIEVNGQLGYELFPHARPITRQEFEEAMSVWMIPLRGQRPWDAGEHHELH